MSGLAQHNIKQRNLSAIVLKLLLESYTMVNLPAGDAVPPWAQAPRGSDFFAVVRNHYGLSVICPEALIPAGKQFDEQARDWRILRVEEPRDLGLPGLYARLTQPLADDAISIYIIGAYNADHILVRGKDIQRATQILSRFCSVR